MATLFKIKSDLVVFLRNRDILSTSDRGVTTQQDTGSFSATSSHTLATNPTLVKNVRDVTVASVELKEGVDYSVNYVTGVISFTSPQTGAYEINYDTGSTDRIFPDFPQPHLKLKDFPRIAVDILSATSKEIALGATTTQNEYPVTVVCYSDDQDEVEQMIYDIRQAILDYKKELTDIPFMTPTSMGPLLISEFGEKKIMQRNQDLVIKFEFESR